MAETKMANCYNCKWHEHFNAICFNADSDYCATCPDEYGVSVCGCYEEEKNESK